MARTVDLDALRRRLGNLTVRDLRAAALAMGWAERARRGKGSHIVLQRNGRTLVIPMHPNKHTYRSVLDDMERWS